MDPEYFIQIITVCLSLSAAVPLLPLRKERPYNCILSLPFIISGLQTLGRENAA